MKNLLTAVVGLVVFIIWIKLVGNPHVVETVLGLIISIFAAFYTRKSIFNRIF